MKEQALDFLNSRIPRQIPQTLPCRMEGDFFMVMDPVVRDIQFFNRTAKHIYDLCDGTHTIAQILDEMAAAYKKVKAEQLRKDVYDTIHLLELLGMVHTGFKHGTANVPQPCGCC